MIRAIIIDDEAKSRNTIAAFIERYCTGVTVAAQAANVQEAVQALEAYQPRLVFLDVSMPDGNGFDVLKKTAYKDFEVIFITAHNEYAIQAIKASALDYLLKPVNIKELQDAVNKAKERIETHNTQNVQSLLDQLDKRFNANNKIAVPVNTGLKFVPMHAITRLEADGCYTRIYSEDTSHILSSRPLKQYEEHLPAYLFFRAHHSHIINLEYIKEYHRGEGGYVTMADGTVIDISKRKKKQFLELFHALNVR